MSRSKGHHKRLRRVRLHPETTRILSALGWGKRTVHNRSLWSRLVAKRRRQLQRERTAEEQE